MNALNTPNKLDSDTCWAAVLARDVAMDGRFYYSVKTTGVYCRPSCPSRRPNRKNVQFHLSCAEAEHAGSRPCQRCKPNEPTLAGTASRHQRVRCGFRKLKAPS